MLTGVDNGQQCSYHAYKDNLAKNQREGVNLFSVVAMSCETVVGYMLPIKLPPFAIVL